MPVKVVLEYNCKYCGRSNWRIKCHFRALCLHSLLDHCRNFYTSVPKAMLVHSPGQASLFVIVIVLSTRSNISDLNLFVTFEIHLIFFHR